MKTLFIIFLLFISGYAASKQLTPIQQLNICSNNYDEINTSFDEYNSNGNCVVNSFIQLLSLAETTISYSENYQCDEDSHFFKTLSKGHPKSFKIQ